MRRGVRGSESVARWTHSGCKGGVGAGAPTAPQRPEPRQAWVWVKQVCPEGSLESRLWDSHLEERTRCPGAGGADSVPRAQCWLQ